MSAYIQTVIDFIAQHPHWAGVLVFLTAGIEAVAVIGAFVPGTTILISVGAIVGLGHLPLWPILIWATLGAIVGDGVSYWLGHRYGHHIGRIWPFSRRPNLLAQGEAFFRRHGAKSVVIGRFLPMTRAIVPLVAGTLGMNPVRFYIANVLSAIVWAPLHILPGVVLGGFLTVVGGISGRLVAVLLGMLLLGVLVAWLLRVAVLRIAPWIAHLQVTVFTWANARAGLLPRMLARALDPANPGARTVLLLGVLGAACGLGFLKIVQETLTEDSLAQADQAVSHFVQGFRTAWADNVMVVITMLGDTVVMFSVAVAVVAWLLGRRQWHLAAGFAVTIGLAQASVSGVKAALQQARPIEIYSGAEAFSFPSGHATMAAVLYGTLAWMVSTSLSLQARIAVLAVAGGMVGIIAASRIYLAAHWPSDVAAGITLGFGLAAIFALVYRRIEESHQRLAGLLPVALIALLGAGSWHVWQGFGANLERYARQQQVSVMAEADWRATEWRTLPQHRIDLAGEAEEPFVLQWAGTPAELEAQMKTAGWVGSVPWTAPAVSGFATPATAVMALPALPLLHDGRAADLTLISPAPGADRRLVLRAWPSGFAVDTPGGRRPILLASLMSERIVHPWNLASLPRDEAIAGAPSQSTLTNALSAGNAPTPWSSPRPGLVISGP